MEVLNQWENGDTWRLNEDLLSSALLSTTSFYVSANYLIDFFVFVLLEQIEKIMNLIGAGIETSKKKPPTPSSGNAPPTESII